MSIFQGFPALPPPEDTPLCVINEVYCCANSRYGNISTFTNATKNHPKINVTRDIQHHKVSDENISLYVDVEDKLLKKITSVWYKQGFLDALSLAADQNINRECPLIAVTASYVLKVANLFTAFRYFIQPHLKDIGPKIVSKYSRSRNWNSAPIKCLDWHPHTTKIAVATADDNVRVYSADVAFVSALKCKAQGHVSSLSWRPYSASEIAVGCEQGVIVWTVDPNSMFTKPSSSNAIVLKSWGHSPVTDVSWCPSGALLASCSAADPALLLWDVALGTAVPLRRVAGGGLVFARWSLDGTRLFAATSSIVFRVWDTEAWRPERWVARGGRVVAACWGPNNVMLFAAKGEPVIYALTDTPLLNGGAGVGAGGAARAQAVLDVSRAALGGAGSGAGGEAAGGPVLDMCWCPRGRYLALTFEETHLVAVFATTQLHTQLKITPCCLVRGVGEETPTTLAFQRDFAEGACLTVAWSGGRLQHFPVLCSP
ncbi:Aladin [Papilio machaon]|uniref:Aladin n=1 Tax=Papilio machaon TaxID=76193 RepID=A0A194R5U0_PAPMA|nr:Aladin [Papilio machaon]